MSYCVVIPAAGVGTRMGAAVPKVLLVPSSRGAARSRSILQLTVSRFAADSACLRIVVCAPSEWRSRFAEELAGLPQVLVIEGGATRQGSVLRGMETLEQEGLAGRDSVVLVHDAARCCITSAVVDRVVAGVINHGAVTAAVPVVDSVCRAADGTISGYVDREGMWAIQTPQGFLAVELLEAHRIAARDGFEAFDDAALVARTRPIHLVQGDRFNIKVTQPDDLKVAELILSGRQDHGD